MKLDRLTEKSQEAIQAAQALARDRGHPEILPAHLLLALLDQGDGIVPSLLTRCGLEPAGLREELGRQLDAEARVQGDLDLRISRDLEKSLEQAKKEASALKDDY